MINQLQILAEVFRLRFRHLKKLIRKTKARIIVLFAFLSLLSCPKEVFSITLDEYQALVERTRKQLSCSLSYEKEKISNAEEICQDESLADIKKSFPPRITISSAENLNFEIDNSWLLKKLDEIEATQDKKRDQKILETIYDLMQIQESINEVKQQKNSNLSKDEEKRKLEEILKRPEFAKPEKKEKSSLEELINKFLNWLESLIPRYKLNPTEGDYEFQERLKTIIQTLFIATIAALVGFIIYRFFPYLMGIYALNNKSEADERIVLGEELSDEETADTLFDEAEKLALSGDLRRAIRKCYIAFLCELGDKGIIKLKKYKTNRDYLNEVSKSKNIYEDMKLLTSYFERFWYGLKKPELNDWERFREKYLQSIKSETEK